VEDDDFVLVVGANPDFQHPACAVSPDEQVPSVLWIDAEGVSQGVQDVFVGDPTLSGRWFDSDDNLTLSLSF
jgi:hypothetical protein